MLIQVIARHSNPDSWTECEDSACILNTDKITEAFPNGDRVIVWMDFGERYSIRANWHNFVSNVNAKSIM